MRCQKICTSRSKKPKQCSKWTKGDHIEYCTQHKRTPNKPDDHIRYDIRLVTERPIGAFADLNSGRVFIPTELKGMINEILECKDHAELARKFGPSILANLVHIATKSDHDIIRAKLNMFLYEQFYGKARERIEISGEVSHNLGVIYIPQNDTNRKLIDMDEDNNVLEGQIEEIVDNVHKQLQLKDGDDNDK